jgi:hypothetical protein
VLLSWHDVFCQVALRVQIAQVKTIGKEIYFPIVERSVKKGQAHFDPSPRDVGEGGSGCKGPGAAFQNTSAWPGPQTQPGMVLQQISSCRSLSAWVLSSLPCFLLISSLLQRGWVKPRASVIPLSVQNRGYGRWQRKRGVTKGPAKLCAPHALGALAQLLWRETFGAKVSGNGAWRSRRPEVRARPHSHPGYKGFCSHPLTPSYHCGLQARHPHALGGGDSQGLSSRGPRHRPRAATLAHGASPGATSFLLPEPAAYVCLNTSSPLAEGFWEDQSEEEESFGREAKSRGTWELRGEGCAARGRGKGVWGRDSLWGWLVLSTPKRGPRPLNRLGSKAVEGHLQVPREQAENDLGPAKVIPGLTEEKVFWCPHLLFVPPISNLDITYGQRYSGTRSLGQVLNSLVFFTPVVLGIEPSALRMLGKLSATELPPPEFRVFFG